MGGFTREQAGWIRDVLVDVAEARTHGPLSWQKLRKPVLDAYGVSTEANQSLVCWPPCISPADARRRARKDKPSRVVDAYGIERRVSNDTTLNFCSDCKCFALECWIECYGDPGVHDRNMERCGVCEIIASEKGAPPPPPTWAEPTAWKPPRYTGAPPEGLGEARARDLLVRGLLDDPLDRFDFRPMSEYHELAKELAAPYLNVA